MTNIGVATLLLLIVASAGYINFQSQAKMRNGNWYNCDGQVDNDSAHHNQNPADTDPSHHQGENCDVPATTISVSTTSVQAVSDSQPQIQQVTVQSVQSQPSAKIGSFPPPVKPQPTNNGSNPFAGAKLYINYNNDPANYVKWNSGWNAQMMQKIASQPEVEWLGGWNWNITGDVSNMMKSINDQGALPVFVVYNIPNRDCGGYSSGGINDAGAYRNWVSQIANTIGNRKAVVILEPDAITLTDCLNSWQQSDRNQMLKDAINTFKSKGQISVYLDAGHPNWLSASDVASRLRNAGIDQADGFALNIANFYTNPQNADYGKQISDKLGGKHFLVDTGRNGNGATWDNQWCNPSGRSLGTPPTTNTGNPLIDAYLWVKGPGGSDGNCNGGPSAGQFWPDYAIGLASRTNW